MNQSHLQALVDGMSAQWQKDRAESQMTLGKLIAALEAMPADAAVPNLRNAHSYRGYYSDLAFELGDGNTTVAEILRECRESMGQVFEGYKGVEYVMGAKTPIFVAHYGCCGTRLMGISVGAIETAHEED